MAPIRIVTFNVNGLRSIKEYYASTKKWSFDQFLNSFNAEVICFQETKVNKADLLDHDLAFPKTYDAFFAFPKRPKKIGYSGVVTYVKQSCMELFPVRSHADGFTSDSERLDQFYDDEWLETLDSEARVMMTDHGSFILFNVYFPNDGGPERVDFRERFYSAISIRFDELVCAGRTVIVACDLNSTYTMPDHCEFAPIFRQYQHDHPDTLIQSEIEKFVKGEMRKWSDGDPIRMESFRVASQLYKERENDKDANCSLVDDFFLSKPSRLWTYYQFKMKPIPWIDPFRLVHPDDTERYTCWNTLMSARGANYGTRIDYVIAMGLEVSKDPRLFIKDSNLMADFMGSDHCPVWVDFELPEVSYSCPGKPAMRTSCPLAKQHRLDSFFKPVTRMVVAEKEKRVLDESKCSIKEEAPPSKQVKMLPDSRLPFAKVQPLGPSPSCPKHGEPGKLFTVNKAGPNRGRKFYVCSRPVGHPTDPAARCNFFQWQQ